MGRAFLVLDEMPKSCMECDLFYDMYDCGYFDQSDKHDTGHNKRVDTCKLKEIPEPKMEFLDDAYAIGWNDCLRKLGIFESN